MFVTLGIEEYDATIIEVEGSACTAVMFDSMPRLPVAPDALDDDDRLLVAMGVELF